MYISYSIQLVDAAIKKKKNKRKMKGEKPTKKSERTCQSKQRANLDSWGKIIGPTHI